MVGSLLREETKVNVREEKVVLPTYNVKESERLPIFYRNNVGSTHQGVQRRIYPYPMEDRLSDDLSDKAYQAFFLENNYVKICIMPCLGGRIFSGLDKTNNYDFFYRHHRIKPALIGMLGAWISGGNAWGFPHHHGPNTIKPMDYTIKKNSDESVTVWVANTDLRHRMRILIGYTLFPGKSIIEMTIHPFNQTPIVHSMLFWANPSVHVDETYQVVFPPSVEFATQHHKIEFITWPVANSRYNAFSPFDYTNMDVSWWKNVKRPSSFFSWKPQEDYFAGYNHGKQAGVAWVGNHHICPGMKFWAHGHNPEGDMWENMLTDTDGHYIELMAGAYTDNQPDYSWLQPYESKSIKMVWFPIRNLEGLKYANLNGALNLEVDDSNVAKLRLNTTSQHHGAIVRLEANGQPLFEETIDISPAQPYGKDVSLPPSIIEDDLRLSLISAEGDQLLSYQRTKPAGDLMPKPYSPPPPPKDVKTVEELYLAALRLNQLYNAPIDPDPYYEEALSRDPGDSRVNTQLGILYCKRKLWKEAEEKLNMAIKRITHNYTSPKDGEAFYYLGVALRHQGKTDAAYDAFYKATWSAAWHTAAYYALAEIDCQRHDFLKALEHLNRSISTNTNNLKALTLKATVLRKLSRYEEAMQQATIIAEKDLLDYQSRNELFLLKSAIGLNDDAEPILNQLKNIMRNEVQSYLELALDYGNCGFYDEAIEVLSRLEVIGTQYPMIHYYLGYYWAKKGENEKSLKYYKIASELPTDYCFPFRAESIDVLRHASTINPKDANAPYYLGNLLYEHQPENAITEWEKSRTLNDTFYIVHRNLGLAYEQVENNTPKAIASLEKAIAHNNMDSRLFYDLDALYEKARVPPEQRLKLLEENHNVVAMRDDALSREVLLYTLVGKYDKAIDILSQNHFNRWEGSREIRILYEDAHLLRGQLHFRNGKYSQALKDYQAVLEYPENLDIGKPPEYERFTQVFYLIGRAYDALGKKEKAREHYEKSIKNKAERTVFIYCQGYREEQTEYNYYKGLAYQKMGCSDEASQVFDNLLRVAQERLKEEPVNIFVKQQTQERIRAEQHYLSGLAYLGKNRYEDAKTELTNVLKLKPNHLWAIAHLQSVVS